LDFKEKFIKSLPPFWYVNRSPLITVLLWLGLMLAHVPNALGVELESHRTHYLMNLLSAEAGSGVNGVSGVMVYSFNENCSSWSSETNVNFKVFYSDRGQVEIIWSFASFEAKDGTAYSFQVQHSRNGSLVESFKGKVNRPVAGAPATVQYSSPNNLEINLPSMTLFPARHLISLITAGEAGKRILNRTVFGGASNDNPYGINAIIGNKINKSKKVDDLFGSAGLREASSRHFQMAFFPKDSKKAEPKFELGVVYRSDGIAKKIRQDFGDFVVELTPNRLELIEKPKC